jgi:hypothetical protein
VFTILSETNGTIISRFRVKTIPRYPQGRHKIGLTKDAYDLLKTHFKLHLPTIDAFPSNNGSFAKFDSVSGEDNASIRFKVPSAKSTGLYAISITQNWETSCVYTVYYAHRSEDELFSVLQAETQRCSPCLVPRNGSISLPPASSRETPQGSRRLDPEDRA